MSSLLDSLMKQAAVAKETVDTAKSDLTENPRVELVGVNAPEFENATQDESGVDFEALAQSVDLDAAPQEEISSEDPMEQAYANKPQSSIRLPMHEDGLDDDEEELTEYHAVTQADEAIETAQPEFLTQENWDDHKAQNGIIEEALGEDGEPVAWSRKPFTSRYFNFGGRTVNSLARENLHCFDDIKGWAYSELKAIKGFGQGCLDELLELLEAENQTDWLLKRKQKGTNTNVTITSESTNIAADAETHIEDSQEKINEEGVCVSADEPTSEEDTQDGLEASREVSDDAPISERDAEAAEKQTANPIKQEVKSEDEEAKSKEEVIVQELESSGQTHLQERERNAINSDAQQDSEREGGRSVSTTGGCSARMASARMDTTIELAATENSSKGSASSTEVQREREEPSSSRRAGSEEVSSLSFKVLVMGNASAMNDKVRVATFEQVYAEAIREICVQSSVPSISMIEYNKGWQALASVIRQNGWPQGVDVLNVSKSFMSRSDVLLELRLLADLVIDG